ncbi:hypothetical protein F4814DRAFT_293448 [Daldinia grandis]|nr:hypothetical protein F4814DRAFT_293448 [Daldinia grandis]
MRRCPRSRISKRDRRCKMKRGRGLTAATSPNTIFSCYIRDLDFHGLYGDDVRAYVIAPGKDYYIGDHLKQELMLHRESSTDDAVLLHMYHGEPTFHLTTLTQDHRWRGIMWDALKLARL